MKNILEILNPTPNIDFEKLYEKITALNKFEEFNEFHKSSFSLKEVREYIISLTLSMSEEELSMFYENWAQSLHINDSRAKFINDCRRIWLFFGYSLVNKCRNSVEEEMQIRTRFRREIRLMLIHCLPLDRANALFNMRIPWFHEGDRQYFVNTTYEPSINKRLVYLMNLLEINEASITRYFVCMHPYGDLGC